MHEATIALAILKRAAEAVSKQFEKEVTAGFAPRVTRISLDVGEFRNVDPDSLEFAFQSLRKDFDSIQDAQLDINQIEALATCNNDTHEFRPAPENYFACTACGAGIGKMIKGDELNITAIELEEEQTEE